MTQYNTVNVKLSDSQLNKLESEIKNTTHVTLRISLNIIRDDETNSPQRRLLTDRPVENVFK